jgi:hypothetical protein
MFLSPTNGLLNLQPVGARTSCPPERAARIKRSNGSRKLSGLCPLADRMSALHFVPKIFQPSGTSFARLSFKALYRSSRLELVRINVIYSGFLF